MENKGSVDMYAEDPILPDEIGSKKSRREGEAAKSTSDNHSVGMPTVCSCTILWNSAGPFDFVH